MNQRSLGYLAALFLSVSSVPGLAQETAESGSIDYGEIVRHPFQLLTLSGNVIGLPRRDDLHPVAYKQAYSSNDELCADFERIIMDDFEGLIISTQAVDLGGGYYTPAWNPMLSSAESNTFLSLDEQILHDATWITDHEDTRFRYRAAMISQMNMGRFEACYLSFNDCVGGLHNRNQWTAISEFAESQRWGSLPSPGSIQLLGTPEMYGNENMPNYDDHLPGYWLYQFLNLVINEETTYIVYFRPVNLWRRSDIPDDRGVLVWDLSDQDGSVHTSCWFEEKSGSETDQN